MWSGLAPAAVGARFRLFYSTFVLTGEYRGAVLTTGESAMALDHRTRVQVR